MIPTSYINTLQHFIQHPSHHFQHSSTHKHMHTQTHTLAVKVLNTAWYCTAQFSQSQFSIRHLSTAQFSEEGAQGEWDRIQVLCRQPWRKDVQLGLSFLRLRNGDSGVPAIGTGSAESSVSGKQLGQKNKVADIQKHFFGDKSDE